MNDMTSNTQQSRGPVDHNVRDRIVEAAREHFSHYGYEKTTVSDLAKAIGFSKAYIYKFFDSKQAIGQAICSRCLSAITDAVSESINQGTTPTDRFRRMFETTVTTSVHMFFNDRKLYDIAAYSAAEKWPSAQAYEERIKKCLMQIIREGREAGEFERKTPLDDTVHAIFLVMEPYVNPLLLQHNLDQVDEAPRQITNLVLRSLAP
jgi:AcrR family transcriptional regulator